MENEYFDLYNGEIRLLKKNIKIQEILDLIKKLSDKDARATVLYIFLLYDRSNDNPLKNLPEKERRLEAKEISGIDFDKVDSELLAKAIKAYKKENIDDLQKELDLYDKKLFEFIELLEDEDSTPQIIKNEHESTGKISFSTNIDIITNALENALTIIVDKAVLADMKSTGKYNQRLRGTLSKSKQKKLLNKIIDVDTKEE